MVEVLDNAMPPAAPVEPSIPWPPGDLLAGDPGDEDPMVAKFQRDTAGALEVRGGDGVDSVQTPGGAGVATNEPEPPPQLFPTDPLGTGWAISKTAWFDVTGRQARTLLDDRDWRGRVPHSWFTSLSNYPNNYSLADALNDKWNSSGSVSPMSTGPNWDADGDDSADSEIAQVTLSNTDGTNSRLWVHMEANTGHLFWKVVVASTKKIEHQHVLLIILGSKQMTEPTHTTTG